MNNKYIKLVTVYTVALSPSWGCTRPSAMGQLRLIVQTAQFSQAEVAHTGGSGSTNWGTDFAITWTGASSVWGGPEQSCIRWSHLWGGPGYPQNTGHMDFSLMYSK